MKKSLAILMSVALLFSALACGMVLTTSAWSDDTSYTTAAYIDFSNNDVAAEDYVVGNANSTYDSANKALKIYGATKTVTLQLPGLNKGLEVNKHPVLAFKVRLETTGAKFANINRYSTNRSGGTIQNYDNYAATTDWQLMVLDISNANNPANVTPGFTGNWTNFILYLDESATKPTMYIQWAGLFTSRAHAEAQFAATAGEKSVDELPSNLFIDLSTETSYNAFTDAAKTNTNDGFFNMTHSWDGDSVRMTLAKSNGAQIRLGCHGGYSVSGASYPILAMKVKLHNTYDHAQWGKGPYFWANNYGPATFYNQDNGNAYNTATSDWQLVTVDMSSVASGTTWTRIQAYLDMLGGGPTMSIQWIGYFASVEEATWYYNGEIPSANPIANKPSRQANAAKDALRFGFDVATADYAGISYVAGDYAAAQAAGNYARKLDNAKMKINGQMVDIVGFGALITKSNLADDAFVAGAAGVKAVEATNLYGLDANKLTYTVRITGIPADAQDAVVYARSYVAYNDGGETVYVYGDIVSDSVNGAMAE